MLRAAKLLPHHYSKKKVSRSRSNNEPHHFVGIIADAALAPIWIAIVKKYTK
jgi:hypothetical protein